MNNWKYEKLSTLCSRVGDGIHGTPEYVEDSEIYFINGNNLDSGRIEINSNTKKVSSLELNKNFIPLNKNSLLISINGTIGSMAFYNNEKVMLGKSAAYLNFNSGINKFYYYYFQLDRIQKQFYNVATGSTIKNLSLKSIQDFEVPVPEKHEWQKIANVLSALDAKIELNNRINAELEAMAKTLYDYWFVQFEFPNSEGKPYKSSGGKMVWNEELKREIPEGWEVKPISAIVDCNKWTLNTKSNFSFINYLDTSNLTQNAIDNFCYINCFTEKVPSRAIRVVSTNDILISTIRPNQCHFGIIKEPVANMIASSGFAQIRSKDNSISNDYIYFHLTSESVISRLQQIAETSVSAYPSVSPSDILNLNICIPIDRKLLKPINTTLNLINKRISNGAKENKYLSSLRDWLLPMLMNGQVTVNEQLGVKYEQFAQRDEGMGGLMAAEVEIEYKK